MQAITRTLLLLAVLAPLAPAQSIYGTLVGTVTDESGALLPRVAVTAAQSETNVSRSAVTNDTGNYNLPNLLPGTYQVTVTLAGFQTFTARGVNLEANTAVRLDARMKIGEMRESISVSAEAVALQTETAAVQSNTTSTQLVTAPTSGRAWQTSVALMPGVSQPDYVQSGGSNNPTRAMAITVNGQPPNNTVVRLDGVTQINQFFQQIQAYSPSLEAIETVSVVTNSFDADQGMAGGASINVQVKSGTNRLSGSLFDHATDYRMKAKNFFLPPTDPKGTGNTHSYGGTVGGPIRKDKLFYFGSLEKTRQRTEAGNALSNSGANGLVSLPTVSMRLGDFAGTGVVLYDPLTGNANGTGKTQFPVNTVIPASRINPISARILTKLVTPTLAGFNNNYYATNKYDTDFSKYDGKITWVVNNKTTINGRLGYATSIEDSRPLLPSVDSGPNSIQQGRIWDSTVHSHSVAVTSVLSPSFVLDGVFGFTRTDMLARPHTDDCWGDLLGIRNSCQAPLSRSTAIPRINASTWTLTGGGEPRAYRDPQWGGSVNAGWNKGKHNIKFGGETKLLHQNHYETQTPTFTFTGGRTALAPTSPNNFNAFADYLLGDVNARTSEIMTPMIGQTPTKETMADFRPGTLRTWQYGTYVRDQFELTKKMTVSLGLRWEYYPLSRRSDRGLEVFNFNTNLLDICGVAGNAPTCGVTVEKTLFTPRLGWAYRPTDTTVIRVGYSRNPENDTSGSNQQPPSQVFPTTIILTEAAPNNYAAVGSLSDGVTVVPKFDLSVGKVKPNAGLTTYQGKFVRGKITSFNVTVQKLLPGGHNLTVGYVANRQENMTRNANQNYGKLGGGTPSQPYFAILGTTSVVNVQSATGKVQYDSLQASMSRRFNSGFQYTFAYTFSKSINWWAGAIPQPEYFALNKAQAANNTPHLVNTSVVYELPFGKGKKYLQTGSFISKLAGGWQVNGFLSLRSGSPYSVTASNASLNAGAGTNQQADQVKANVETLGGIGSNSAYFDVTAFRPVTDVRFGTSGFNSLRGPGIANLDASLFRTFRFKERMSLQLRVEALNSTNTPHFANPASNVSNLQLNPDGSVRNLNGFGVITSTNRTGRQYDEREMRLGVRFGF
ncbi:MAG: TonB-dependent receptor family protein [Bryobacterales bacterium]|nr:TonB-dependent receptor family protein [Bryobacterales bacterium]